MKASVAQQSICLLVWMSFLPSMLGFQSLPSSVCQHRQRFYHAATADVTRYGSSRFTRSLLLNAIWGGKTPSSSSADGDEDVVEETTEADAVVTSEEESSSSVVVTPTSSEKSLLTLLNEIGNNFQALAQKATAKGYQAEGQNKKIMYAAKACAYYTLFIVYRAYRGFFVLLPAVFMQVYRKMEGAMATGNLSLEEIGYSEDGDDAMSKSTKWRTKVTVSILTSVVTISYVVGGVLKMATKFFKTIASTSDVPKSFEAAADEVMSFEGRISRVGKVNGDEDEASPSGLTP